MCSVGLHQGNESSGDLTQVMGDQGQYTGCVMLAAQHLEVLTHILQCLGFIINAEKSVISPTQELEFLGMLVNTNTLLLSLPADKVEQKSSEWPPFQLTLPGKAQRSNPGYPSS